MRLSSLSRLRSAVGGTRSAENPLPVAPAPPDGVTPADVAAVYAQLLGRTPTPDEVEHQLANAHSVGALLDVVLSSEERRRRAPGEDPPRPQPRVVNVYAEELAEWGHPPGTWSDDGVAVVGHAGWLFLGGGSHAVLEQHRGEVDLPADWGARWREAMDVRRRDAAELGVRLHCVMVPDKLSLLRERFPEPLPPAGAVRTPAARLAAGSRLGLDYPVAALRAVPGGAALRTDTHLTYHGSAALAQQVGRALGAEVPVGLPEDRIARYLTSGDLGSRFAPEIVEVVTARSDFGAAEVVEDNHDQLAALGGHIGVRQVLRNASAADARTVVVFGDSYAVAAAHYQSLTWFLAQAFRCVHFVWSPFGWDPGYVARVGAAAVVCEGAERFAVCPPELRVDVLGLPDQTLARLRAEALGGEPSRGARTEGSARPRRAWGRPGPAD